MSQFEAQTKRQTESGRAFIELLDMLRDADASFLNPERGGRDDQERSAGYRALTHMLAYGLDFYLESDPARPHFSPMASPTQKILGDNVDSVYRFAPLDPARCYRIRGVRGNDCYISFCVYGGPADGQWSEHIVANVNQRDIAFAPDGSFEIILSATEQPGTWVELAPDAVCVISREYFFEPERPEPARFEIETPAPLADAELAARLRAVKNFVRACADQVPVIPLPAPNMMVGPIGFDRNAQGWGTPDNVYALGEYEIDPDQALVIHGSSPPCAYWGVQVWNRYLQSLDYRHYRVSINREQAVHEPDGSFKIVIANRDPGVPNWIDTAGHGHGLFFCRWLLADEQPATPTATVVAIADLAR
jgi:hypothetical protein